MATITLGTTAQTSLTALKAIASAAAADVATIQQAILDDLNVKHPIWPGAWSLNGRLYFPNRGSLLVLPGDYIGVDSQGWPILVSANSIANAAWIHT